MRIRDWRPDDLDALHRINEASTPGVGSVSPERLAMLAGASLVTLVADAEGAPVGFLICLGEGAGYTSPNYLWVSQRHERFAYVDRVGVDPVWRGRGVGGQLYETLLARVSGLRDVLACEVNERPPNPGSLRFHRRLGFLPVGRQAFADDKAVVYLERPLG